MTEPPAIGFLDVQALLERSLPRRSPLRGVYLLGLFILVVLTSAFVSAQSADAANLVRGLSAIAMIGVMAGLFIYSWHIAKQHRAEQLQLEAIEELVTLRRWPQAALLLQAMLGQPTRSPHARVQALIYLAGVLARYHRFDDAIAVQDHLLEAVNMDESTAYGLRLGRAMAMLREDHLFDADRAIADLKRRIGRENSVESESNNALPQVTESAGLALIEMYRDVKTGHPTEALDTLAARLPAMRRQLSHRVADAWALAAKAHDLLGQETEAQTAFENATLLSPMSEMIRRYPEIASIVPKYKPATAPAEAA
jgi:tetratricopeptide (TPR) repeat protein